MFQASPDLSVNTVAEIVRLAVAPVFLLSGIGAFLNVLRDRGCRGSSTVRATSSRCCSPAGAPSMTAGSRN